MVSLGATFVAFVVLCLPRFPERLVPPPNADGPPAAHTGGFGEPTCQACHLESELNAPGGVLGVEGLAAQYEPGGRYPVTVVLLSDGMDRAGFQGAFRFAEGEHAGTQAGRLQPIDTRVVVRPNGETGIVYVQHSDGGTAAGPDGLVSWRFVWTAPPAEDPVVFHVAANSANGDNSPFGDLIYTAEARTTGR